MNLSLLRTLASLVGTLSIAFALLWPVGASARELMLLVPPNQDQATREFIEVLTSASQIKEAGLTFRLVRSDEIALPGRAAELVLRGIVPLALIRAAQIPGYQTDTKDLMFTSLLSHPLIVKDSRQQFFVEDSVVGDVIKQELGRKGFVVLGFWNTPSSSLVFSKPVRSYADLKGLKVRTPDMQSHAVLQAFGASPTMLALGEIYAALERGTVDGSEARVERGSPYLSAVKGGSLVSSFMHGQGFLVAHEASWIELRQRERAAIQAAAAEAKTRARDAVLRADADLAELARTSELTYASFASMEGEQPTVRSTWLKRVGDDGTSALSFLDRVIRQKAPPTATPSSGPRSSAPAPIYFATNRNDEGGSNLSYRFGIERSSTLRCGEVRYTPDMTRAFGIAHKGEISVAAQSSVSGAESCARLVGAAARGNGGALIVFIHGFNNSFDFAVRRAIGLAQDFGLTTPVLVFSWPSFGEVSGYIYDIHSVTFSRPLGKELTEALLDDPYLRSISLLAHSMGSQLAIQMLEFAGPVGKPIDSVVFVAPDVPRANFIQGVQLYGTSARLATLYANENDRALLLSQTINKQTPAGLGGPSRLTTSGVETVDVSEVDKQWLEINHSHGFDVPKVASDVSLVLRQHANAATRSLPSAVHDGLPYWLIEP